MTVINSVVTKHLMDENSYFRGQYKASEVPSPYPYLTPTAPSSNEECPMCGNSIHIDNEAVVVVPSCQHKYHANCGVDYVTNDPGDQCPICTKKKRSVPVSRNTVEELLEDEDEDEGIPIDHGNDAEVTRRLERQFGKQGLQDDDPEDVCDAIYWKGIYGNKSLNILQKNKLLKDIKNPVKINKAVIDKDTLLDNDIMMEDFREIGVNILDIYFSMGIKNWDELVEFGMEKDDLLFKKGKFMPLDVLIDLYFVTYDNLSEDLDFNMGNMIEMGMTAKEMKRLELDFNRVLELGLDKVAMIEFDIPLKEWIATLGMRAHHLKQLKFKAEDFSKLKWNTRILANLLMMSDAQKKAFGIDRPLSKQTPKKTKNTDSRPISNRQQTNPRENGNRRAITPREVPTRAVAIRSNRTRTHTREPGENFLKL